MASAGGRKGIDQERGQKKIGNAAEERGEKGDGGIDPGLGSRGSGLGKRMRRNPARNENIH